ncbi:hypothetical protein KM043_006614 [Ampulex compressa]|nr:hypothetical protein KM043_006614 [Ampulex compressa]
MKEQLSINKEKLVTLESGFDSIDEEVRVSSSRSGEGCKKLIQYVKLFLYVELALFLAWAGYTLMQTYRVQPIEVKVADNIREAHPQLLLELEYTQRQATVPPEKHYNEPSTSTTRDFLKEENHEGLYEHEEESKKFALEDSNAKESQSFEETTDSDAIEEDYRSLPENRDSSRSWFEASEEAKVQSKDSSEEEYSSKDVDSEEVKSEKEKKSEEIDSSEEKRSEEEVLTWDFPFLWTIHDSEVSRDADSSSSESDEGGVSTDVASTEKEFSSSSEAPNELNRQLKRLEQLDTALDAIVRGWVPNDDIFGINFNKAADEKVDSAQIEELDDSQGSKDSDYDRSSQNLGSEENKSTRLEDIPAESEELSNLSTSENQDTVVKSANFDPDLHRFIIAWKIRLSPKDQKDSSVEDVSDPITLEKEKKESSDFVPLLRWFVNLPKARVSSEERNFDFKDPLMSTESSLEGFDEDSKSELSVEKKEENYNEGRCKVIAQDDGSYEIRCAYEDTSASTTSSEEVTTVQSSSTDRDSKSYSYDSDYFSDLYQDYHTDYDGFYDDKWLSAFASPEAEEEATSTDRSNTDDDVSVYKNFVESSEEQGVVETSTSFEENVSPSTNDFVVCDPPKETKDDEDPAEAVKEDLKRDGEKKGLEVTTTTASSKEESLAEEQRTGLDQSWSTTESNAAFEAKDMAEFDAQKTPVRSVEDDKRSDEREIMQTGDQAAVGTDDKDKIDIPDYVHRYGWNEFTFKHPYLHPVPSWYRGKRHARDELRKRLNSISQADNAERKKRYVIQRSWIEGGIPDSVPINKPLESTFEEDLKPQNSPMLSKMRQSFGNSMEQALEMDLDRLFERMEQTRRRLYFERNASIRRELKRTENWFLCLFSFNSS